ncbi:hypothetical protein P153DRAFT_401244, partial [Dothidotthia symphoricarpi CBS 119687]
MLVLLLLLSIRGLATAQQPPFCTPTILQLNLPGCTDECLIGENKVTDGTCATNLDGFCALSNGFATYFNEYGACLLRQCPDDADRYGFVELFQRLCAEHPTGYQLTSLAGEWATYITRSSTALTASPTASIITTTAQTSPSSSSTSTSSSIVETTSPSPSPMGTFAFPRPASTSSSHALATTESSSVVVHTIFHTQPTSSAHSSSTPSASPLPPPAKPPLNTAQIAVTATCGALFLAFLVCGAVFLVRRRKEVRAQSQHSMPASWESEYSGGHGRVEHAGGKAELDGEAVVGRWSGPALPV